MVKKNQKCTQKLIFLKNTRQKKALKRIEGQKG